MNDSMVDRVDDQEPVTITEALEIPQPRAVGSPLSRGTGNRVSVPQTYADLEDRMQVPHPGPILAPPPSNFSHNGPLLAAPAAVPTPGDIELSIGLAPESATPAPAPAPLRATPAPPTHNSEASRSVAPKAALAERPPSALRRAAGIIRQAIPIVQKLLPLLDGNIGTAVTNLMSPPARVAPPAPPVAPPRVDLTSIKEDIAELQTLHKDLRAQIVEQNNSLKRVEDQLGLVREATDRNTLEQQELLVDLKAMGTKVNVVAAVAIGLLAISLMVNLALYMHIQRVLP